jgi:hypothetical protein
MLTITEKELLFSQNCFEFNKWTNTMLPSLCANDAIALLLSALPILAIKDEATFITVCQKFLRVSQCEQLFADVYEELVDFLINNLLLEDMNAGITTALADLTQNFHRFGGRTKGDFVLWAARRLKRHPDLRKHSSVRDFIALGTEDFGESEAKRMAGFEYTIHGDEYHIPIGIDEKECPILWKVLDLKWAKDLWPVHAMKFSNGKYFAAKTVNSHTVAMHRLRFNIDVGDKVEAYDGDFLNFCYIKIVTTRQWFCADWSAPHSCGFGPAPKKDEEPVFKPLEGVTPPVEFVSQEDVLNIHVAHDSWGRDRASVKRQNDKNWRINRRQFLQVKNDEGEMQDIEFTEDGVRAPKEGRNTPANRPRLDVHDRAESQGIKRELRSAEALDAAIENPVHDGHEAGRESDPPQAELIRPTAIDSVDQIEAEIDKLAAKEDATG